jgi:hypothetical protein
MTTTDDPRIALLGDALQEAAAADLARAESQAEPSRPGKARRARPKRRLGTRTAIALAAAALAIPAAAIATGVLSPDQKVANSVLAGTYAFAGTEPTCTTLRPGLEYECVLAKPANGEVPKGSGQFVVRPGAWDEVVEGTVDESEHVNGGCRSQNAEGTHWLCYLGQESVNQKILMPSALGDYAPEPAGP